MDRDKRHALIEKFKGRNDEVEKKWIRLQKRKRAEAAALKKLITEAEAENWRLLLDSKFSELDKITLLALFGQLKDYFENKQQPAPEKA